MRIIGGKLGGIRLQVPKNLPVRPTTDIAKEALFNILDNKLNISQLNCLDLFSGTGNIALELASRSANSVKAVDIHFQCVKHISETAKKYNFDNVQAIKSDVLKFIKKNSDSYDLIFADPPYDMDQLPRLAKLIIDHKMLSQDGWLIVEHPSTRIMDENPYFVERRKYGFSSFSFYKHTIT